MKPTTSDMARADARMYRHIEGDDAQELPGVFSVAFNYQSPLGTWLWQQGEPLTDDDDDGAALANLVAGVHGMAEERDADGIIELMSIVIDERATAFGVPRAVVLEQLRGCYQDLFAEEDFAVAPLDGDNFAPRLHCDNRLLELVQSSGEPTIRQTDESDDVWGLPLLLGKIDGEWTVLSM